MPRIPLLSVGRKHIVELVRRRRARLGQPAGEPTPAERPARAAHSYGQSAPLPPHADRSQIDTVEDSVEDLSGEPMRDENEPGGSS